MRADLLKNIPKENLQKFLNSPTKTLAKHWNSNRENIVCAWENHTKNIWDTPRNCWFISTVAPSCHKFRKNKYFCWSNVLFIFYFVMLSKNPWKWHIIFSFRFFFQKFCFFRNKLESYRRFAVSKMFFLEGFMITF